MNRFYQGDWIDSMASRFVEELPEKFIEKNTFYDQNEKNQDEEFEFNQDFEVEEGPEVLVGLDIKKELNDKKKLNSFKNLLKIYSLDGYIIPKNDCYFTEQVKNDRLKLISNFSGSAGIAVVLKNKNYLFIDSRYTIQAKMESGKNFSKLWKYIKNCPKINLKILN